MANAYFYSNTAVQTTLSGNISGAATSITVAATTGFPGSFPYILALDYGAATEELVSVTAAGGTTLTVTRGFGGTSAQSHSIGAVVRHVYNSQDATDFRTHEAATASVHGVTGALVGATSSQTLTNKTLTSPTVNGATISGTFAGAATFSGALALSGGGSLAGTFTGAPTLSGAVAFTGAPTFSQNTTFSGSTTAITATGEIAHSNLYRGTRANATDSQFESRVTGDANARFFTRADGRHAWGPGTTSFDTVLYRSGVSALTTDGSLAVGTTLAVASTSWTTYTPTWTNLGTATMATNEGYYYKLGKIVIVNIFAAFNAAGSGGSIVTVTMPSSVDRSHRQVLMVHGESIGVSGSGDSKIRGGEVVFFTGGTAGVADRIRVDVNDGGGRGEDNLFGVDIGATSNLTIQGWYREA